MSGDFCPTQISNNLGDPPPRSRTQNCMCKPGGLCGDGLECDANYEQSGVDLCVPAEVCMPLGDPCDAGRPCCAGGTCKVDGASGAGYCM